MELRVKKPEFESVNNKEPNSQQDASPKNNNSITKDDLENMFNRFDKQINPESALSPQVRSVVKAVEDVQGLKNALKDPTSIGLEQATSNLVTTVLSNTLSNMSGTNQQVAPQKPLLHALAQIATNNISANLPQVLETLKSVLGTERLQKGYDAGVKYIESKQPDNFVDTILALDENNDEHVVYYAQQMGYTDFNKAKNLLIEHKVTLYKEQQDYQNIQQGENQPYSVKENTNEVLQNESQYIEPIQDIEPIQNRQQNIEENIEQSQNIEENIKQQNTKKPQKIHIGENKIKLRIAKEEINNTDEEINSAYEEIDGTDEEVNEIFKELDI